MIAQIVCNVECSRCGSINMHRDIIDSTESVRECKHCGHRKIIWTMRTTDKAWEIFAGDPGAYTNDITRYDTF